jgi:hypothetical protein
MTPMQILGQLYAGKRIKLQFQDHTSREAFRQRIYKVKKKQDDVMAAVLDEEKLILKCKLVQSEDGPNILELWTEEKKAPSYTVLSIEDGEKETNDAGTTDARSSANPKEIPSDLAEASNIKTRNPSKDSDKES